MTRHLPTIARYLLGAIFTLSGIAALLMTPPQPPERLQAFMTGIVSTGYFLPLLKFTEIGCGVLLLANRFVPLALIILSPVIVQITSLHLFLDRSGLGIAVFLVVLQSYLGWAYRAHFRGVLAAKAEPARGSSEPKSSRIAVTAS